MAFLAWTAMFSGRDRESTVSDQQCQTEEPPVCGSGFASVVCQEEQNKARKESPVALVIGHPSTSVDIEY